MKVLLICFALIIFAGVYRTAQGSDAAALKVCPLVTPAEIHDIVGITVGAGEEDSMMADSQQCSWAAEEENALSLLISFQSAASGSSKICSERYEGEKKIGRWMEDASGFGQKAWWSFQQKEKDLSVLSLNTCLPKGVLRVNLWGSIEKERHKKMIEELTRKSLSRIH